jgi:hypothetical protein
MIYGANVYSLMMYGANVQYISLMNNSANVYLLRQSMVQMYLISNNLWCGSIRLFSCNRALIRVLAAVC